MAKEEGNFAALIAVKLFNMTSGMTSAVMIHPRVEVMQRELKELRAKSARLFAQAEFMQFEERPMLTSVFESAIGALLFQEYKLGLETKLVNLEISLVQAYINHNAPIDQERIDIQIKAGQEEYRAQVEKKEAEIKAAQEYMNAPTYSVEESNEIRDLYRMLVKALHPDLHPRLTQEEHDLFLKVVSAYRNGDLQALRQLALAVQGQKVEELATEDLPALIERAKESIEAFQERIDLMNSQFPFLYRDKILDPEWLQEQRVEINQRIVKLKARLKELRNYLIMLKSWKPDSLS